ncbi:ABC transporter permease subunit [Mesoplasma lactucae]|uniref:Uncharacterized protein n=1 Tax=Mesoplasma lactucae ATCC 49193 TaxID=81460 RepID=A0A291ISF9_9MOLU|nr:hypothetical protein [Mesoplasma lactucae]ATG97627.1 hypothetical protein CP520_02690 [Mesoplasma lactucae ATCC 49193]ATZ19912.1 ribose/galactose ABC transporter permease [Mesoplasma lactucae ATCC 49193]MCL8216776.1 hypothetical protein [Mesoplasma lactucae ATCC 49193]
MNKFFINNWKLGKRTKDVVLSYETKQKAKYVKGSLFAIILGLILAGIIIAVQNVNPFVYLRELFKVSFSSLFIEQTFQWIAVYIIAGLAVGIGFKSGMFNIGVSGQMLIGAGVSIIYYKLGVVGQGHTMNAGHIIVIFLICVFSGAILAGIAGALKALFNIHEVVTTIMLNWTVWYLLKFLFTKYQKLAGDGINTSASMPADQLAINGSSIAIPLIIAVVCLILVAILLSKTVFGYKLKAVGSSPNASKYAGFNVKAKMTEAMVISGALAGVASFVNVLTLNPNIAFSIDNLPSTGYDAIAIALVAFNNPIGIFFTSFLWGILQSGGSSAASLFNMPNQTSSLVFGIIVYFAAISTVFMNYYPILRLKTKIALASSKATRDEIKDLRSERSTISKEMMSWRKIPDIENYKELTKSEIKVLKADRKQTQDKEQKYLIKKQIKALKKQQHEYIKEYRNNLKETHKKISQQIKIIKHDNYVDRLNSAMSGINRRQHLLLQRSDSDSLTKLSQAKSDLVNEKDTIKKAKETKLHDKRIQKTKVKKVRDSAYRETKAWKEGTCGDITGYYDWFNSNTELKGEIKKYKIKTQNKIESLNADYKLDKKTISRNRDLSHEEIKLQVAELKAKKKNKVAILKERYKVYKIDQKNIIKQKSEAYKHKRNNPEIKAEIKNINIEYKQKNKQINIRYKEALKAINLDAKNKRKQINASEAKQQYAQLQQFVKDYKQVKKNTIKKGVYSLAMISKIREEYDLMLYNIENANNQEYYNVFDTRHIVFEKTKLYKWLAKELYWIQESSIAYQNVATNKEIKVDTKQVKKVYNENIGSFSKTYKEKRKSISKNKALDSTTRRMLLDDCEREYETHLNNFIAQVEAKTRTNLLLEREGQ